MRLAKEILNQVPLVQPAVTPKEASVELEARGLNKRELELGPSKSQVNNCQVRSLRPFDLETEDIPSEGTGWSISIGVGSVTQSHLQRSFGHDLR